MRLRAGDNLGVNRGPRVRAGQIFGDYSHSVEVVGVRNQQSHAHFGRDGFGPEVSVEPVELVGLHRDVLFWFVQFRIVSAAEKDLRGAYSVSWWNGVESEVGADRRMPAPAQAPADKVQGKIAVPDQRMIQGVIVVQSGHC